MLTDYIRVQIGEHLCLLLPYTGESLAAAKILRDATQYRPETYEKIPETQVTPIRADLETVELEDYLSDNVRRAVQTSKTTTHLANTVMQQQQSDLNATTLALTQANAKVIDMVELLKTEAFKPLAKSMPVKEKLSAYHRKLEEVEQAKRDALARAGMV